MFLLLGGKQERSNILFSYPKAVTLASFGFVECQHALSYGFVFSNERRA